MYLSIRRYKTNPAVVEELMQRIQEEFVPILSQGPGFLSYYAVDEKDGMVTTISVFEDLAGAEQSNAVAANWVKTIPALLPDPPEVIEAQVKVHKDANPGW